MFRTLGAIAMAGVVVTAAAVAQEGRTEFGVDVGLTAQKASATRDWAVTIRTPVDLRIGIPVGTQLRIEPRIAGSYVTSGGYNLYALDPGLNLLIGTPGSTERRGMYVTVGADYAVTGGSGMSGEGYVSFNAGFGVRSPLASAAWRPEMFVAFTPKQGTTISSSVVAIGMRLGLSFFN